MQAILLDIDKAVRIVRETAEEAEVVPNLMIGFGIDQVQAEYCLLYTSWQMVPYGHGLLAFCAA